MPNTISLLKAIVQKSNMEIRYEGNRLDQSGTCTAKTSLSVPKALEAGEKIISVVDLEIGDKSEDYISINLRLKVWFQIEEFVDTESFNKYAQKYCVDESLSIMQKKLEQLTDICFGEPLVVSLR